MRAGRVSPFDSDPLRPNAIAAMCQTTTPAELDAAEVAAAPYRCAAALEPCGEKPIWRCRVRWKSGATEDTLSCPKHLKALLERGYLMQTPEPYREPAD